MAERRMFAKVIVGRDSFMQMPLTTQALYFHLAINADDEGFVSNPHTIQRMIGASEDDFKLLMAKSFILNFSSGIVVIKDWKIHNYIRGDRIRSTVFRDEKNQVFTNADNEYEFITEKNKDIAFLCEAKEKQRIELTLNKNNDARNKNMQMRAKAFKASSLPCAFTSKIVRRFVNNPCPVCGKTMNFLLKEHYPTVQHNIPLSKGGKHELNNISVICFKCNSTINDSEVGDLNNKEVIKKWYEICAEDAQDSQVTCACTPQVSIGKVSKVKDLKDICVDNAQKELQISIKFDRFWNEYPKKIDKKRAFKTFRRINPDDKLLTVMIEAIKTQELTDSWCREAGQFIPYPATWLNGERWNDEPSSLQGKKVLTSQSSSGVLKLANMIQNGEFDEPQGSGKTD